MNTIYEVDCPFRTAVNECKVNEQRCDSLAFCHRMQEFQMATLKMVADRIRNLPAMDKEAILHLLEE